MDMLKKILLFYLFGILLLGVSCQQRAVKDRKRGALVGKLITLSHNVAGTVWAVDEDTLYVEGFYYDGKGPDAFFWMGNDTQPSPRGFMVQYPIDTPNKKQVELPYFNGENIIINLPAGRKIVDMKYLSVWCRRFTVDFGHVLIPGDLDPPRKYVLPEFKRLAHGVRSGNVTILDAKTFYIPNLHYDGGGPDAYFWVGNGYEPNQSGHKVPNEMNSLEVIRGYEGEDIEIQLPDNLTVYDIDYLAIWCVAYRHNFGHVLIPHESELWVPPALGQTRVKQPHSLSASDFDNCRQITDDFQIQWQARDDDVQIKLIGRIDEDQYMSFGISPDENRPVMINSDVVVAYYDSSDGSFHAVDYTITGKSQCDGTFGVCPDERVNGRNDASVIGGERNNGITSITYSRPYSTVDDMDLPIERRNKVVSVITAVGSLNARKEANYHHEYRTKDEELLDFASVGEHTCTPLVPEEKPTSFKAWPVNVIKDTNVFQVDIGPTGGERGYDSITGSRSWGIAWWINGLLIPEIHVERGQTYTFTVEGGDDLTNSAKYHPFYITESKEGAFSQQTLEEQQDEKVFAGISYSQMGVPQPSALGRLCEWRHRGVDTWKTSQTFESYKSTLHRSCEPGIAGELVWNVTEDTPDIVYYQCYTHRFLGWRIHVHDAGFTLFQSGTASIARLSFWIALPTFIVLIR